MSKGQLKNARRTIDDAQSGKSMLYLLVLYLALEFIRPQDILPGLGSLKLALLAGVPLIIFSFSKFQAAPYKDRSIQLMLAFVGLCAISATYAVNTHWAFEYTKALLLYAFAAVIPMCILINSEERLKFLIGFWIVAHTFLALYAVGHGGVGPGSFLSDENDVALALNCAWPFAYFLTQDKSNAAFLRLVLICCVVIMVVAIVATASRGGFLGLACTTVSIIWFSQRKFRNLILVVVGSMIFYLAIPSEYKGEIESISDTEDGTRQERFLSWGLGWDMFLDNPVLGVGAGNYPWRVSDYQVYDGSTRMLGGRAAHSLYFTLIPETGSVGIFLFLGILYILYSKLKRTSRRPRRGGNEDAAVPDDLRITATATTVSLVGFLSSGAFISVLYYPQYWYFIGIVYCIGAVAETRVSQNNSKRVTVNAVRTDLKKLER